MRAERTELRACTHVVRRVVAIDDAIAALAEERRGRLREQKQSIDAALAGERFERIDEPAADAAFTQAGANGERTQQAGAFERLYADDAYDHALVDGDDELHVGVIEVVDGKPGMGEQRTDRVVIVGTVEAQFHVGLSSSRTRARSGSARQRARGGMRRRSSTHRRRRSR